MHAAGACCLASAFVIYYQYKNNQNTNIVSDVVLPVTVMAIAILMMR
jgi:CRISPR/Cas system-associated endonuclease Cas3-HD